MAYTYSKHEWQTQEPITAQKMNDIETGIENLSNDVVTSYYNKTQIDDKVTAINDSVSTVRAIANSATTGSTDGTNALNQIKDATINNTPSYTTLSERFTAISGKSDTAYDRATATQIEVVNARFNRASLSAKIAEMDTATTTLGQSITGAQDELTAARDGETTLSAKINSIDDKIEALETEIKAGDNTTTLTEKITAIKSDITTDKTDISNIKATIGAPISSNPDKTIRQLITDNATNAQTYTNTQLSNAKVDEIIGAHRDDNDTLDARFDDIEDDITTHSGQLTTIEGQINTLNTSVGNNTSNIEDLQEEIENAHTQTNTTLASRFAAIDTSIAELLNKSSTIVISQEDFDELQQGDSNIDYIVGPDNKGKYYYWKWINQSWNLISGGGSGNSSGVICASEAEFQIISPKEENVDYYVLMDDNKYHHYRYYNENIIEIGHVVDETQLSNTITSNVTSSINTTLNETVTNLTNKIKRYRIKKSEQNDNNYLELYEFQYTDEIPELAEDYPSTNLISSILLPAGGGGGGSSTNAKLTVARRTPQNYYVLASENTIQLGIFFSSYDDANKELYNGNYTLYRGGTIIDTGELLTDELHLVDDTGNYVSKYFDIKNYCNPGVQNFTLVVTDTAGNLQRREWRVELVELYLTTEFDDKRTYPANTTRKINIVPFGSGGISKTIVASIDNANSGAGYITITTTTSGSLQELTIPASILTPGAHLLKIYVKQIIGQNLEPTSSEPIYLDIVCINNAVQKPIISSIYRRDETNTQEPISVPQYTSLKIPYYVYDPIDSSPTVTISKTFDNITTSVTENLKDSNGTYIFKGQDEGNYFITISCKNSSITIPIVVTALGYEINPITEGLIFDFNPVGLSNTSTSRMWTNSVEGYENIKFIIPEGESFDWYNGGYQVDEDNNTYFCIKSGSRIAINTSLFNKNYFKESDTDVNGSIERSGAEFKCIFKTTNVKRGDATFLTCKDNDQITVTVYDNDVTDSSKFKEYLNVAEIYKIEDNKTVILAVTLSNSEDITSIEAAYGDGANHRTINDINLSGKTTELSYSNESLKRYQILNADGTIYCIYEEQYDNEHNGWIITRIKPVSSVLNTNLGLEMKAHEVNITSRSGVLTTPYSEDDRIEFEYNINSKIKGSYMLAYEDGVSTLPLLYYSTPGRDNFIHNSPGYIILGSDDCDLHIYRMKFYNKSLTNQQILMNFYADAPDGEEMVQRYERNTKLYNDPHSESGILSTITPQSVANACPNLKVLMIEAPQLTGGKKDFVKNTKIRCIQKNGRPEDNWVAFNAYHSGQGTSSDNYGMSGRNLDIIFGFNGVDTVIVPKKNNYSFDANYKSVVVTGVTNNFDDVGDYNSTLTDLLTEYNALHPSAPLNADSEFDDIEVGERHLYRNGTGKISLSKTSVPNNWFNIKVNIASSENANNALLQKRFDRYLPYDSPAKKRDSNIKNDMEFYNTVIFIRETGTPTEFKEDARIEASQRPWHFYGIGNIGDSKKTDDTRVNIPGDPNEFCIEISDNGLANSGFDTGVYYVDNDPNKGTTYNKQYGINSLIKYPISSAEWTNPNNLAHKSLYDLEEENEVNWDKSFEFRYDLTTKDGNTIDEEGAAGELAAQRLLNNKRVFADMYSWIATCPNASFANELSNWFVEESPLYWYLFTERYTMIDSRAKNTFYHYGKYYITTAEAAGDNISTLEAELADLTEGTKAYAIKLTELNTARFIYENSNNFIVNNDKAAINNGYRFDMWDYDNDTALGINNNGKMVFSYGLEDTDKLSNGSWVYNEATSVFWRRIRENCYSKLSIVFNKVNKDCWNAENLIKEFDTWQEQFPEEIWRLDFERKYLRPYTVYSENKYLKDMANGRKKYQRRQFERDMAIYIYSKYNMGSAYESDDTIEFRTRATSASGLSLAIKPYGTMYVNVMFGNTETIQQKVQAGELVSINPPTSFVGADNTQIIIYNASRIQEIGALAGWQLDTMKFSKAIKLQKLILGADSPFNNNYEQQLTLANPILEELDIRNYTNMQPTLDLTNCPNLKILKAQGTNVQVITFASGGLLQETYYPSTLTDIYFTNLNHLNTVSLDGYTNLAKIESLDTIYNIQNIVNNSINNLNSININNISWTNVTQTMMEKLFSLSVSSILKGTVYMSGLVEEGVLVKYRAKWPELTLNTDNAQITEQFEITFQYTDISGNQHVFKEYVEEGQIVPDPMTAGLLDPVPGKPSETEVDYIFGEWRQGTNGQMVYQEFSGWKTRSGAQMQAVGASSNMTYIAVYNTTPRKYSVEWYVDNVKVDNTTTDYGGEAITEYIPANKWDSSTNSAKVFIGWDKSTGEVKENMVGPKRINAKWLEGTVPTAEELQQGGLNSLNEAQLYALSKIDQLERDALLGGVNGYVGDYKDFTLGHDYEFDNVESNTFIEEDTILGYNVNVSLDTPDERTIKVYDNQVHYNNQLPDIRPLSSSDGFTLVLDYNIYKGVNRSYVMSCYQDVNNTEKGFQMQVINGTEIAIIWGGNYANRQTVNTVGNRGIIVLRKPKNSNDLKLYYDNSTGLTPNITTSTFYGEGEGNIINVPLVLGSYAIVNPDTGAVTLPGDKSIAKGIIHWGKYWNADLGDNICKKLASSCHEKIRFRLQGYNDANANNLYKVYEDSTNGARSVNLSFIATKPLEKNYEYTNSSPNPEGETNGWRDFDLRTICNNKIYNSMPVALKSIIADTPTRCFGRKLAQKGDNMYTNQYLYGKTTVLDDYIYIPTYYELKGTNTMEPYPEGIRHPIPWITTKTIYTESGISNSSIDISRIMFKYKSIPTNAHYFNYSISSNPYNRSNELSNITVNSGDVWVPSGGSSNTAAYMYVTQDEVNKYNLTIEQGAYFACANGGWIKSTTYWTRTINYNQSSSLEPSYYYVQERGSVEQDSWGTYSTNNSVIIQFSI